MHNPANFFQHWSDAVAIIEPDWELRYYNPAWFNLMTAYAENMGHPKPKDTAQTLFEFVSREETDLVRLIQDALETQQGNAEGILTLQGQDEPFYWSIQVMPLAEENSSALICVLRDVTTITLEHKNLRRHVHQQTLERDALIQVAQSLISAERDILLDLILEQMHQVLDYTEASIAQLKKQTLTVAARRGSIHEPILPVHVDVSISSLAQRSLKENEAILIPDLHAASSLAEAGRNFLENTSVNTLVLLPLIGKEGSIGLLALCHAHPNYYNTQAIQLARAFADFATVAMEHKRLYTQAHHLATLQERDRLARELHDSLAQSLGYLNLKISMTTELLKANDSQGAEENLRELKQLASETYTDVREEIFSLRTTVSSPAEFYETLNSYLEKYRLHYQLDVQLELKQDNETNLPADVGNQIIRIIQEALINIRKHAQVKEAFIKLETSTEGIHLTVEDHGRGFDLTKILPDGRSGYGLQIMRERAESVGGELHIESKPGDGSKIIVTVPFTSEKFTSEK